MRNKTISFLVAFAMLISIVVQPVSAVVNTASQEASIEKLSLPGILKPRETLLNERFKYIRTFWRRSIAKTYVLLSICLELGIPKLTGITVLLMAL